MAAPVTTAAITASATRSLASALAPIVTASAATVATVATTSLTAWLLVARLHDEAILILVGSCPRSTTTVASPLAPVAVTTGAVLARLLELRAVVVVATSVATATTVFSATTVLSGLVVVFLGLLLIFVCFLVSVFVMLTVVLLFLLVVFFHFLLVMVRLLLGGLGLSLHFGFGVSLFLELHVCDSLVSLSQKCGI